MKKLTLFIPLFILAVWMLIKPTTPEAVYDEYFEPYIVQTTPRGLTEGSSSYMMGTSHYREMNYEMAISEFKVHLKESPNDYRVQLMLAVSYLALKNFKEAEPILIKMVNDSNHLFQDQARWYLGLLYLTDSVETNDGRAKEVFQEIEDNDLKKRSYDLI